MADKILHKRSLTPGSAPTTSSLDLGELAINVNDGKLYLRQSGSITDQIVNIGESASFASTASYVETAQTASYVLNAVSSSYATSASFSVSSSQAITSSFALTASYVAGASSFPYTGSAQITGSLGVTGSVSITQNLTASSTLISGSGTNILTVQGSGSADALFIVSGSSGELFSVTDTLSGDLFTVTDANTDTIFNISSSYEIQLGNPIALSLYATTTASLGTTPVVVYSLPTASYDGAFFNYTLRSGSNARAGNIMAIWDSTSVNFTETTTTDFGDTSGVTLLVAISGSSMTLSGSATTEGWNLRTIVRSI